MRAAITILTVLFLCLLSFMLVLTPPVTHFVADGSVDGGADVGGGAGGGGGSVGAPDFEHDYLVAIADAVRDYSMGNDAAALPIGADDKTAMTADILSHLRDVRAVFITSEIAFVLVSVLLAAVLLFWVRRSRRFGEFDRRRLATPLILAGIIPMLLALLLVLVGTLSFSVLFTAMHSLFFAAGTWTFAADSLLIRALPQAFWIGCAIFWAVSLLTLCLASLTAGLILRRK
jgi:integral membrane protein (TIGR01906 family)